MLKSIRTPIITIIVTLVSGYLLFLFTRDKPDVRYTLSEGIPVSFPSANANTTETVQQLEVKNLGTAQAEGISIQINAEVVSYELAKNSNVDNVQIFDQSIPFEIFYTELPPQGSFTFVFTTKGQSVKTQELKISYSKGNAKEALSSETFSLGDITGYAILIGYVLAIIAVIRSFFISSLKSTYDKDLEKIMLTKQPWYLSEKSWSILHFEIIEKKVFDEYFTDVEKSNFYKFLSFEKLEHIKKQEWDKLTSRAIERLNEGCLSKINNAYKTEMILTLLSIEKPKYFPDDLWNKLIIHANEKYVQLDTKYPNLEKPLEKIKEAKPSRLIDKYWEDRIDFWKSQYVKELLEKLSYSKTPLQFMKKQELGFLAEKDIEKLFAKVHNKEKEMSTPNLLDIDQVEAFLNNGKPEWMNDIEYKLFERQAENLFEFHTNKKRYSELIDLLNAMFNQDFSHDKKPEHITDPDWEKVKEIRGKIIELEKAKDLGRENRKEAMRLQQELLEANKLIGRVEKQLRIIHEVLVDPTSLTRLEDYDNTFAPGNIENLEKVAQIVSQLNENGEDISRNSSVT